MINKAAASLASAGYAELTGLVRNIAHHPQSVRDSEPARHSEIEPVLALQFACRADRPQPDDALPPRDWSSEVAAQNRDLQKAGYAPRYKRGVFDNAVKRTAPLGNSRRVRVA